MISVPQLCKNRLKDVKKSFQYNFIANVQVYEFYGKSEMLKKKKLWITTNKKVTKKLCRKIYIEIIITHTTQAHSKPSQTSKMKPFANINNYFRKKLHLRGGLYGREFQPGLKFQLVKPWWDFISHVKRQSCKNRITIICKNFIKVNRAEISPRFEQTELKFSFHVNVLKIIL